jgi:hypothetical protein
MSVERRSIEFAIISNGMDLQSEKDAAFLSPITTQGSRFRSLLWCLMPAPWCGALNPGEFASPAGE